ncbi:MAG: hypothetical protein E7434_00790 [Ruminococcaceae bacterium]|nr:hypothetical protein [Oscillospiraceae bacterium]
MKTTKILLCMLLSLCLILIMCACAGSEKSPAAQKDDTPSTTERELTLAEKLVGEWALELDVTDMIVDQLEESLEMDLSDKTSELELIFDVRFDFEENGNCELYFDEASMEYSMGNFFDDLCPILADVTYEMLEAEGMSKDETDEMFEVQFGSGVEEYFRTSIEEGLSIADLFGELPSISSTYKLEGDQLTIAVDGVYGNDAATISIDGDVMTVDGILDAELQETLDSMGLSLPWIMTRR